MASNGRTMVSSKESVVFKVEQVIWPSTKYYFYNTNIPEKARCHGCRCVPHTIYPLENECQGHGLCRDCKEIDFTCFHHHGDVTAEAVRNAVGRANVAAKKLILQCPFCESYEPFLNINDHMAKRHLRELVDTLKSSQKTKYKKEKPASNQEKQRTSSLTLRKDNFSQNADVTVVSEDDEAPACKHCKEEWDAHELGEHEKACPKKEVQCRECDEWIKQGELSDHKNVVDTILHLQQKIKEMERCNISQQEEARNESAKLEKRIEELENRQNLEDTISELEQKIKDMELCNMSQQEEARNEKAKLVKRIQELENRQMSQREEASNEIAKLVKRIQELENCQLEANQYHIDLEDDVKVHRTALQNLEDKVGRISKEAVTRRRVEMLNERVETYLGPLERLLNGLRQVDKE